MKNLSCQFDRDSNYTAFSLNPRSSLFNIFSAGQRSRSRCRWLLRIMSQHQKIPTFSLSTHCLKKHRKPGSTRRDSKRAGSACFCYVSGFVSLMKSGSRESISSILIIIIHTTNFVIKIISFIASFLSLWGQKCWIGYLVWSIIIVQLVIIQMNDSLLLQRMTEHYDTLVIANRKALALFRSQLRQSLTAFSNKSALASEQQTKAMSTINERSKAAERDSEDKYSRKVSDDLQVLFEVDPKDQFNSVQRNQNFLQKLGNSSHRGWTITDTRESLVSFERVQPNCTDFQHE